MRRLLRLSFGLIALVVLALATLPWWLGPVLPAIGRAHGFTFNRYERIGYARFTLETVAVRAPGTSLNLTRVEADSPLVWLWRRAFGQPGAVVVDKWRVEVVATPPSPTPGGWLPLRARLQTIFATLRPWLPRAQLGVGTVRWPGGGFSLASVTWQDATLKLRDFSYGPVLANAELTLFPRGQDLIDLTATLDSAPIRLALTSRAADLTGQLFFTDQPAALTAHFAAGGWFPATAALRADTWTLPAPACRTVKPMPTSTSRPALSGTQASSPPISPPLANPPPVTPPRPSPRSFTPAATARPFASKRSTSHCPVFRPISPSPS